MYLPIACLDSVISNNAITVSVSHAIYLKSRTSTPTVHCWGVLCGSDTQNGWICDAACRWIGGPTRKWEDSVVLRVGDFPGRHVACTFIIICVLFILEILCKSPAVDTQIRNNVFYACWTKNWWTREERQIIHMRVAVQFRWHAKSAKSAICVLAPKLLTRIRSKELHLRVLTLRKHSTTPRQWTVGVFSYLYLVQSVQ